MIRTFIKCGCCSAFPHLGNCVTVTAAKNERLNCVKQTDQSTSRGEVVFVFVYLVCAGWGVGGDVGLDQDSQRETNSTLANCFHPQ